MHINDGTNESIQLWFSAIRMMHNESEGEKVHVNKGHLES